jgi:hypothetical protein
MRPETKVRRLRSKDRAADERQNVRLLRRERERLVREYSRKLNQA